MKAVLVLLAAAGLIHAADRPLYVFDDWPGVDALSIEQRTELVKKTGYAGIFYSTIKNVPELMAAHKARGLRVLGVYTGMNLSDASPGYDPGLPEVIRQLKGSGALIAFTVSGKSANGDDVAVPVIREIADMAAKADLKVLSIRITDFTSRAWRMPCGCATKSGATTSASSSICATG